MQTSDTPARERILVALDASPQSFAALQAAAQVAAALHAELHGLFVEDADLLCMCTLPFTRELSLYSAQPRPLDSLMLERQLRAQANRLRQRLAREAEALHLQWSFQVARGRVTDELLAAAEDVLLVSLGRVGQSFSRALGNTARALVQRMPRPVLVLGKEGRWGAPLTLLVTGSPSSQRALQLALRLAQQHDHELHLLLPAGPDDQAAAMRELAQVLATQGIRARFTRFTSPEQLQQRLRLQRSGALILPAEAAALVADLQVPVLVVP